MSRGSYSVQAVCLPNTRFSSSHIRSSILCADVIPNLLLPIGPWSSWYSSLLSDPTENIQIKRRQAKDKIYTRRMLQRRAAIYKHDYYIYVKLCLARMSKCGVVFDCTRQNLPNCSVSAAFIKTNNTWAIFNTHVTWIRDLRIVTCRSRDLRLPERKAFKLRYEAPGKNGTNSLQYRYCFMGFGCARGLHGPYKCGPDTSTEQSVGFAFHDTTLWDQRVDATYKLDTVHQSSIHFT